MHPYIRPIMLYMHTALPAEARPLLDHFSLRAIQPSAPFPLYGASHLRLVVSGVGRTSAAAAIAYTCARFADHPGPWLNVGLAGHASAALGTPFIVHRACDPTGEQTYYPIFPFAPPCATAALHTVDKPTSAYPNNGLCDMEGSAFLQTAQRFVPSELAHSLKIVSDNEQHPWNGMDRQQVVAMIAPHLHLIEALCSTLEPLADAWHIQRATPAHYAWAVERWHFSSAQQSRLHRLLQQWQAVAPHEEPWSEPDSMQRAGQVLDHLERRLGDPALLPI